MPEVLKNVKVTARKEHTCGLCECTIPKGAQYFRQTNIYCGDIYDFKTHLECEEVAELLNMYEDCEYDEGLTSTFFHECIDIYIDDHTSELMEIPKDDFAKVQLILALQRCKECIHCQYDSFYTICGCGYGIDGCRPMLIKCPNGTN